jgi:serine/threonine protein kinase
LDGKFIFFTLIINFFWFEKAPEVIQQKDPNCYSTSADVYAYGCVLFEMFSGKLPHTPISNKEQVSFTPFHHVYFTIFMNRSCGLLGKED